MLLHKVTVFQGNDICVNKYVKFSVIFGHGGKQDQVFTFTAFKWNTGPDSPAESQELKCIVSLSLDPFPQRSYPDC